MEQESDLHPLDDWVFDEGRIVTFKLFSQARQVSSTDAQRALEAFGNKHSKRVCVIYLIAGKGDGHSSGMHTVRLVSGEDLEEAKKAMAPVVSCHAYSVQPTKPLSEHELWQAESAAQLELCIPLRQPTAGLDANCLADNRWGSIPAMEAERAGGKVSALTAPPTAPASAINAGRKAPGGKGAVPAGCRPARTVEDNGVQPAVSAPKLPGDSGKAGEKGKGRAQETELEKSGEMGRSEKPQPKAQEQSQSEDRDNGGNGQLDHRGGASKVPPPTAKKCAGGVAALWAKHAAAKDLAESSANVGSGPKPAASHTQAVHQAVKGTHTQMPVRQEKNPPHDDMGTTSKETTPPAVDRSSEGGDFRSGAKHGTRKRSRIVCDDEDDEGEETASIPAIAGASMAEAKPTVQERTGTPNSAVPWRRGDGSHRHRSGEMPAASVEAPVQDLATAPATHRRMGKRKRVHVYKDEKGYMVTEEVWEEVEVEDDAAAQTAPIGGQSLLPASGDAAQKTTPDITEHKPAVTKQASGSPPHRKKYTGGKGVSTSGKVSNNSKLTSFFKPKPN